MPLTLITPPAEMPLTVTELKAHARIDDDSEDALIAGYLRSAVAWADGAGGHLQRALVTQTWDLTLDEFPNGRTGDRISLPLPPLQSVTHVKYINLAGVETTIAAESYRIISGGERFKARLAPVYGQSWPDTREEASAVTVRFVAGYGLASDVPEPIRQAIMMLAAYWFQAREAALIDPEVLEVPYSVETLLGAYRVFEI